MYEVGDRVVITSVRTPSFRGIKWDNDMDKWLGKTMTIREKKLFNTDNPYYLMEEERDESLWYNEDIVGLSGDDVEFDVAGDEAFATLFSTKV